jgi:hypothetical protein
MVTIRFIHLHLLVLLQLRNLAMLMTRWNIWLFLVVVEERLHLPHQIHLLELVEQGGTGLHLGIPLPYKPTPLRLELVGRGVQVVDMALMAQTVHLAQ